MARVYKFAQKEYGIESELITFQGHDLDAFTYNGLPVMKNGVVSLVTDSIGNTPNSAGLSISNVAEAYTIRGQPASGAQPGMITAGIQTFGGDKTFNGSISAANLSGNNSGDCSITPVALGSIPNANGITVTNIGQDYTLELQPASGTLPGLLTAKTQTIGGTKTFGTGFLLPTVGGTASLFNYYESTTHVTTFTGPATTPSLTCQVERFGNIVTLRIPLNTQAYVGPASPFTMTSALPARFRPIQVSQFLNVMSDNSINVLGRIQITTAGGIIISASVGGANFTAATIGWPATLVVTYPIT